MKKRPEWKLLTGDNLAYVEEHQWPPKSYLAELERYQKQVAAKEQSCSVM
mgnify:CR=1 FL=1